MLRKKSAEIEKNALAGAASAILTIFLSFLSLAQMARTKQTTRASAQKAPRNAHGGKAKLTPPKAARKPHKWRAGTVAMREIKRYQNSAEHLVPKAPFKRLVREIIHGFNDDLRVQGATIEALLEASEAYLVEHFERTQTAAVHAKRITIYPKDSRLVTNLAKSLSVSTYMDQLLTDDDKGKVAFGIKPRGVVAGAAAEDGEGKKKKKAAPKKTKKAAAPVAAADDDAAPVDEDAADEPEAADDAHVPEVDDTA